MIAQVATRMPIRSLLFAPASDPHKLERLPERGADAIVLDLEDAVANDAKAQARRQAALSLAAMSNDGLTAVRVNGFETGLLEADLDAVLAGGLDAIVLPKVESAGEVAELDRLLGEHELERGLPVGDIGLLALVETARGVLAAAEIAAAGPRLITLVLGSGDLAADVRLGSSDDGSELLFARSSVVFAAAAAGLAPALDGPHFDIRDAEALRADSLRSRALGFGGRVVIHPGQLEIVHGAYGDPADPDRLRRIVEAFEEAESRGVAAIEVDGSFVDYPVYERARHELGESGEQTGAAP
jgi:citrate lyase subunit beta/citryl-CoA lyase